MKKSAKPKRLPPFTALPQDLLAALVRNRLLNEPARVLLAIYRLTLGYGRRSVRVPYSRIGAMTGIKKWNIPRAVKLLRENGLIMVVKPDYHKGVVKSDYRKGQEYSPVKDPGKWKNEIPAEFAGTAKNNGSQKRLPSVVKSDYHSAPKPLTVHRPGTPKETLKENLLKKERIYVPFDDFWNIFPKQEKRGAAKKEWERIRPDAALWAKIKATLEWQSQQTDWTKDGGKWIPQPDKWLRDERWADKPTKGGGNGKSSLSVGAHDHDAEREAMQQDPVAAAAVFLQRLPEDIAPLRADFARYFETRTEAEYETLLEKLLQHFQGNPEHEAKVAHFLSRLKPTQRTAKNEKRYRVNFILNKFNIPEVNL